MTTNKKIRIITTVGTSIFSNFFSFSNYKSKKKDWWEVLQEDNNGTKIHFSKKKWEEWKEKWKILCEEEFPKKVNNWVKDNSNKKKPKEKSCAELQSIAQIAKDYEEVEVIFLSSYTLDGYLAATIIKKLLEDNILGFKTNVILEKPIEGLVVDKADEFNNKGADNVIQIITDEIYKRDLANEVYRLLAKGGKKELIDRLSKTWFKADLEKYFFENDGSKLKSFVEETPNAGNNPKNEFYSDILAKHEIFGKIFKSDLVFNISGGYKGLIPILTIIGQIYVDIELKYLYEESNGIITIPKMPIQFDWEIVRMYGQYLDDAKISSLETEEKDIFDKMKDINLIDSNNKISITGKILRRYLKNSTPMDSSVIGDYFEYIVYEEVVKTALKQADKNNIICLEKGFEPDYLKNPKQLGDIDVLFELKQNENIIAFMFEAKSVFQVIDDLEKVMSKVINRYNAWKQQEKNKNKQAVFILSIWHFPLDKTVLEANNLVAEYQLPTGIDAAFRYTFTEIAYQQNDSLSENNHNRIFRKIQELGFQQIIDSVTENNQTTNV